MQDSLELTRIEIETMVMIEENRQHEWFSEHLNSYCRLRDLDLVQKGGLQLTEAGKDELRRRHGLP
jgi:hypothetical protein